MLRCYFAERSTALREYGVGGHRLGQLHEKAHLRGSGLLQRGALRIGHGPGGEGEGLTVRANAFQRIALRELVAQRAPRQAVFVTGFHHGNDLPLADVAGGFRILPGLTVVEAVE